MTPSPTPPPNGAFDQAARDALRDIITSRRDVRRLIVVTPAQHFAALIYPRQCLAVGQRDIEPHDSGIALEPAIDQFE